MARGPGLTIVVDEKRFAGGLEPLFSGLVLDVAPGEVVALLGPSGVGKSSLLRLVGGIDTGFSGAISISGVPAREAPPPGLVFQDPRLLPWLTTGENIRAAAPVLDPSGIEALLARVGLPGSSALYPRQMSGGMQRRVALARALATNGQLLLLDEPFVSLDRALAEEMHRLLLDVIEGSGATVLLVTHDPLDAARLADRAVVLQGRPALVSREVVLPVSRRERTSALVAHYVAELAG